MRVAAERWVIQYRIDIREIKSQGRFKRERLTVVALATRWSQKGGEVVVL
jgi:hypothetical protein